MKDIKIYAHEFYYDCPVWLQEDRSIQSVKLTRDCSSVEVDALLYGLIGYNDIPIMDSPSTTILQLLKGLKAKEIIMSGGLLFQEDDKMIFPSCCCGLEEWKEIVDDIRNKKSPWMGHDPFPCCLYNDNTVIVCSDNMEFYKNSDYKRTTIDEPIQIIYTNAEMDSLLEQLEMDMKNFTTGPLARRIAELAPALEETFCKVWLEYFT